MEEVYVVTCRSDGCEECGTETHLVYVSSDKFKAESARNDHDCNYEHLHFSYSSIEKMYLDEINLAFAQKKDVNKRGYKWV